MTRRFAVLVGALVAAAALSSCTTFDNKELAATVNGAELTMADLQSLVESPGLASPTATTEAGTDSVPTEGAAPHGPDLRAAVNNWITVQALGGSLPADLSAVTLEAAAESARASFINAYDASSEYDLAGTNGTTLCLQAIIPAADADAAAIADELNGGAPFAEVFATYNADPGLAETSGILLGLEGSPCISSANLVPEAAAAIKAADSSIGEAFVITLPATGDILLRSRPFAELDAAAAAAVRADLGGQAADEAIRGAKIWVSSRLGSWDPRTATVRPVGN